MTKLIHTVLIASALVAGLSAGSLSEPSAATFQPVQVLNFSLQKLGGGTLESSQLSGRVVLLAIGAKNSPLDRYLLPQLGAVASKMEGKPVDVIWVSTDGTKAGARGSATDDELRAFAAKYRFVGTILRDPDHTLDRHLGISELPAILLLDRKGQLSAPPRLGLDPEIDLTRELTAKIERLLS